MAGLSDPENRRHVAVAKLLTGRVDEAIVQLESVTHEYPALSAGLVDLSAAYLERALRPDRFEDNVRAFDAAAHALRGNRVSPEALFNAALAARNLSLDHEYRVLHDRLAAVDSSPWIADLDSTHVGHTAADLPDEQTVRERVEFELLPAWGAALTGGRNGEAESALDRAEQLARQLAAAGETMPLDGILAIRHTQSNDDAVRALARAHVLFAEARRALDEVEVNRAVETMAPAAREFRRFGSPYALWEPVFAAIRDRMAGRLADTLQELSASFVEAVPPGYLHLLGRVWWTRAVAFESAGKLDVARGEFLNAIAVFSRVQEWRHRAAMETMLAETLGDLGDFAGAWERQAQALQSWSQITGRTHPEVILLNAAFLARDSGLHDAELAFHNELVAYLERQPDAARAPEAYLHRASSRLKVGDSSGAQQDLERATGATRALEDSAVRERTAAEIDAVRGEIVTDPDAAVSSAGRAIAYFREAGHPLRIVLLLVARARAYEQLGRYDAAEADLESAVEAFHRERGRLKGAQDKVLSFEQGRTAFLEMIRIQAVIRQRPDRALEWLERSRGDGPSADGADVTSLRRRLQPDQAVLMMAQLDDRLLLWLVKRGEIIHAERLMTREAVELLVNDFRTAISNEPNSDAVTRTGRPLFDLLFGGMFDGVAPSMRVGIVPDGPLFAVPFGALIEPSGKYFVEEHTIVVSAGLGSFVRNRAPVRTSSALAVGDGHPPTQAVPYLPRADTEASLVAAMYPTRQLLTGSSASRSRLLASLGTTDVFHFAGHSIANLEHPEYAYLLAGSDGGSDTTGAVFAADLYGRALARTSVVVLASCETGIGRPVFGEGALSLAKPFLARGVRFVVASLWPVDDSDAGEVMAAFHTELRHTHDPAGALRQAQIRMLRSTNAGIRAPRAWAAFTVYGGTPPLLE